MEGGICQDRIVEWAEATPMSDKVKEQWAKVPFNVSHNILGCDVVFGDGTTARLGRQRGVITDHFLASWDVRLGVEPVISG